MDSLPVYMVANLTITNKDEYHTYEKGFFSILKKHGGSLITYDDSPETFEGDSPRAGRMILLRFPSEKAAKVWYADPEYQPLSKYRRQGADLKFLTMVKDISPHE